MEWRGFGGGFGATGAEGALAAALGGTSAGAEMGEMGEMGKMGEMGETGAGTWAFGAGAGTEFAGPEEALLVSPTFASAMCPGGCSPVEVALRSAGVGAREKRRSVSSSDAADVMTPSSSASGVRDALRRICTIRASPATSTGRISASARMLGNVGSSAQGSSIGTRSPEGLRATGCCDGDLPIGGGGGIDPGLAERALSTGVCAAGACATGAGGAECAGGAAEMIGTRGAANGDGLGIGVASARGRLLDLGGTATEIVGSLGAAAILGGSS